MPCCLSCVFVSCFVEVCFSLDACLGQAKACGCEMISSSFFSHPKNTACFFLCFVFRRHLRRGGVGLLFIPARTASLPPMSRHAANRLGFSSFFLASCRAPAPALTGTRLYLVLYFKGRMLCPIYHVCVCGVEDTTPIYNHTPFVRFLTWGLFIIVFIRFSPFFSSRQFRNGGAPFGGGGCPGGSFACPSPGKYASVSCGVPLARGAVPGNVS